MKNFRKTLTLRVPERMGFVNITPQVEEALAESGIREGLCLVNAMHITASVFINDDEPGLHEDYKEWLEELAPHAPVERYCHNRTGEDNGDYRRWLERLAPFDASPDVYHHNRTGEDNADAHHKRQVMGREVVVAVSEGGLDFGPWEQIFYGEFDGRRRKRVLVKVLGE